jgi:hypothetical protein
MSLTCIRLFGFLTGSTLTGAGMYYYVIDEYRVSNQLLTEDIYVCLRPYTHLSRSECIHQELLKYTSLYTG